MSIRNGENVKQGYFPATRVSLALSFLTVGHVTMEHYDCPHCPALTRSVHSAYPRPCRDSDLATLYGVETRTLNQQVKRHKDRFPESFAFQLTDKEWKSLRSQIVISKQGRGGRRYMPYVFTEHGVLMDANVLNSAQATKASVTIVEAFVKLRRMALSIEGLARKVAEMEKIRQAIQRSLRCHPQVDPGST